MKNILILLLAFPSLIFAENRSVQFYKGSLNSAKEKAMVEGKLYFVDFVANYCYMCKMMDETTFRDERVVDYTEENYVAIKVNVDDFDGYVWKQKYKIKVLPTILVFNSKGEVVGRYEESMGGTKLLSVLQSHNLPENRVPVSLVNSQPSSIIASPVPEEKNPEPLATTINEEKEELVSEGEGLFEFAVKRKKTTGFGIQIGVFQDYSNVLQEVAVLDAKFEVPILVHITKINNRLAYRVIVGAFKTRNEADVYHEKNMRNRGISGFVKDFTPFL